jgi:hypothetical protein
MCVVLFVNGIKKIEKEDGFSVGYFIAFGVLSRRLVLRAKRLL